MLGPGIEGMYGTTMTESDDTPMAFVQRAAKMLCDNWGDCRFRSYGVRMCLPCHAKEILRNLQEEESE